MIVQIEQIAGQEGHSTLRRFTAMAVAAGVAQGLALACLIPVLVHLVRGAIGVALWWLIALVVGAGVHALLTVWVTRRSVDLTMALMSSMHHQLALHLMRLPMGWFGGGSAASASRLAVRGTMFVATAITDVLAPLLGYVVTPLTLVIVTFFFDWQVGLALAVGVPLVYASTVLARSWSARADARLAIAEHRTDAALLDLAKHQTALRGARVAGSGYAPLASSLDRQRRLGVAAQLASAASMIVQSVVVQVVFGAVVTVAVWRGLGGADPVMMVGLILIVTQVIGPLRTLSELGTALRRMDSELNQVVDLLDEPGLPEPAQPIVAPTRPPEIAVDAVRFGYGDAVVFDGLDLTVTPGSVTAIVGPSGSGKTTLTRLIARFHDVDAGAVRLDSVDVRDMASADVLGAMSLVFQDVYLLDDTLRANVLLGCPEATDAEVDAAAKLARVDEIVDRLPQGWATRVGEGGRLLSGGERQRVSVARAVLKRAPVLLLDEATSSLDASAAVAVQEALRELAGSATVLVIAHQEHTVVAADQVVMLDGGRVVAAGAHEDLLNSSQAYARLWAR